FDVRPVHINPAPAAAADLRQQPHFPELGDKAVSRRYRQASNPSHVLGRHDGLAEVSLEKLQGRCRVAAGLHQALLVFFAEADHLSRSVYGLPRNMGYAAQKELEPALKVCARDPYDPLTSAPAR